MYPLVILMREKATYLSYFLIGFAVGAEPVKKTFCPLNCETSSLKKNNRSTKAIRGPSFSAISIIF